MTLPIQSQSQSYFTTDGLPPISLSRRQAPWDSGQNFFQLNTRGHSPYVTSSLTIGWVCRLQFLLAFASAVILRSQSSRTDDRILLSQIRDSPHLEPRSPYLYPPGTGWCSYTTRHWVPFPSPFTTRRATVEVIRTLLHTLESQSAIPWRINSNTKHNIADFWRSCYMFTSLKLTGLLNVRSCFPHIIILDANLLLIPTIQLNCYSSLYRPRTGSTENVSSNIERTLVAKGKTCPQSCSLTTDILLSPVYTAVTWQCVYKSQFIKLRF
jgi:hypothetical protein